MKLKGLFSIVMALALLFSLVGCGGERDISLTDEDIHTDYAGVYLTLSSAGSSGEHETLNVVWHNETELTVTFGEYYYIEMLEKNEWKSVLADDMTVTAIGLLLPAHSTQEKAYSTRSFDLSREGTYRIRCEFHPENGQTCSTYAIFEVKSGASRSTSDSTSTGAQSDTASPIGTSDTTDTSDTSVPVDTSRTSIHDDYDIRVTWSGWLGGLNCDAAVCEDCLNLDKLSAGDVKHLPLHKFSSRAEIDAFKARFGENYSWDKSYRSPSFNENTADYDDAFFGENDLFLFYISANSGSFLYDVTGVSNDGQYFCIYANQTNNPEAATCDMAGWFITVTVPRSATESCTVFDAVMGYPQ